MSEILEKLASGQVLLADGAMGSLLIQLGLPSGDCPERVNLDKPDMLKEIARQYFEAGADLIQTNTFGGSPLKLAQYDLDGRTEEINRAAVAAVREVIGNKAAVAASCGPCGKMLKPYGDVEPEEVAAGYDKQMRALVAAGVDMICIETMTDLAEATLAVKAARAAAPKMTISATMTFDETSRGFYTIMGTDIPTAADTLAKVGADIVGSNCGNGSRNMIRIATEFRKHTNLPLLIQSNAGLPQWQGEKLVYPETPEFMAEQARRMIDAGVNIIGGCCGSTPDHITALRRMVDSCRPSTVTS